MDDLDLPPLSQSAIRDAQTPPRPSFLRSRKRTRFGEDDPTTSSDPALFSSDDQPPGAENYVGGHDKKRTFKGSWWERPSTKDETQKRLRKREFTRNFDSGIFMGSEASEELASSDSFTMEDELLRDQQEKATGTSQGHRLEPYGLDAAMQDPNHTPRTKMPPRPAVTVPKEHEEVCAIVRQCLDDGKEDVDLSGLSLTSLPGEVSSLQTLSKQDEIVPGMLDIGTDLEPHLRLYLANNRFTIVPTPVLELQNLRVLSLRHNKLKSIPSTIRNLINLESLNVAGNLLNELPYEVIELVREHSLRELTLDPNPWKQLHQDEVFNYPVHSADAPEEISPTEPRDRFLQFLTPITQAATPVTRTNPSPQVPSLTEMALRQLARFDAQNNIDFKSLMPLASPETVLNHLDLLHQQPGRRCTRCRRQIVLAEEEWLEWWYLNMNDRLFSIANYKPYRRLGCRRGCQGPH